MQGVRPPPRIRGHVLCNTGMLGGICCVEKWRFFFNIFEGLKQEDSETIGCTILDNNYGPA